MRTDDLTSSRQTDCTMHRVRSKFELVLADSTGAQRGSMKKVFTQGGGAMVQ